MVTTRARQAAILPMLALLTISTSLGCGTLQRQPAESWLPNDETTVSDPMVVVELREGRDKREYLRAPLRESMLVQDALKGSGAIQRFRRMDVVLVRSVPGGQKLRLPVRYNASAHRVVDENNYALHGGDWLEVTEDTSSTLDRMIENAIEPLRPVMRNHRD